MPRLNSPQERPSGLGLRSGRKTACQLGKDYMLSQPSSILVHGYCGYCKALTVIPLALSHPVGIASA